MLCKHAKKDFRTAVVNNTDNNPSSTTANDSFQGTSMSLAQQMKNEGKLWMLSKSVVMSTWKYGVS